PKNLESKLKKLISFLEGKKVIVAFSGGMDSSLLAYVSKKHAKETLLITERSILYPEEEVEIAKQFALKFGINQIIVENNPLEDREFKSNPLNRCYICKKRLYDEILKIKKEKNFDIIIDGSNLDDLNDYRPGLNALRELNISTPYINFNISKQDIKEICNYYDLDVQSKPSMACYSSRIPYNQEITEEKLSLISKSENFLKKKFDLKQLRVRYHDQDLARIEFLKEDLPKILTPNNIELIKKKLKEFGFCYITIDLEGFRTGSMNFFFKKN
ncbi:MAG TPA: ATP-dependent sacrificial sulfur transferase LarE, partial [Candidatus Lokiarchaeia archaeon]